MYGCLNIYVGNCCVYTFDRYDQLGNDWQDLLAASLQQLLDSYNSEEPVRVCLLSNAIEEYREIMVIIKLLDIALPDDSIDTALKVYFQRQVSSVIIPSKFAHGNALLMKSPRHRLGRTKLLFRLVQRKRLPSRSQSFRNVLVYCGRSLRLLLDWVQVSFRIHNSRFVFFTEIAQSTLQILRRKLVVPRLVVYVR